MESVKAQVRNGRLLLDEPSDLPEGQVVELVPLDLVLARNGDYLDDTERAELHRALEESLEQADRGETMDAFEFLARLAAKLRECRCSPPYYAWSQSGGWAFALSY